LGKSGRAPCEVRFKLHAIKVSHIGWLALAPICIGKRSANRGCGCDTGIEKSSCGIYPAEIVFVLVSNAIGSIHVATADPKAHADIEAAQLAGHGFESFLGVGASQPATFGNGVEPCLFEAEVSDDDAEWLHFEAV
jgi:hypothetical protein